MDVDDVVKEVGLGILRNHKVVFAVYSLSFPAYLFK